MADHTYTVKAEWDAESSTWVATSDDVPGLVTGADTLEELVSREAGTAPASPREGVASHSYRFSFSLV
jgi:hypothetical protein